MKSLRKKFCARRLFATKQSDAAKIPLRAGSYLRAGGDSLAFANAIRASFRFAGRARLFQCRIWTIERGSCSKPAERRGCFGATQIGPGRRS